jgi:hypothetical protein
MNKNPFFLLIVLSLFLVSCSTITSKDCEKDMKAFGLSQGRAGSPKKYTDELRDKCLSKNPTIDLEGYEKSFYAGWMEYCVPTNAFDLGRRTERYVSFCPEDKESLFREKYLVGKHYAELKDVENSISEKMDDIRPKINDSALEFDNYNKLKIELEKVRRDMQALEVEGIKGTFGF